MKKQVIAVLGTLVTITLFAVGGWLIFQPEPAVGADAPKWLTDMKQAQKIAADEKKDLLINFTGSDWCHWCIKLKDEVFSKKEFDKAREDFVLVEMDFPRDESLVPEETRKQNQMWSERFGVEGFPTVVLTDAQGRPYATMQYELEYEQQGAVAFLDRLTEVQKTREIRDEQFAKSQKAEGVEKAKLLAAALDAIPSDYLLPMYREEVEQIVALDAGNKAGLKARFARTLQEEDAQQFLQKLQSEVQTAYTEDGEEAAIKKVQEANSTKDAKDNPVLRARLGLAEVNLLVTFEKPQDALARLDKLTADKSLAEEDLRAMREYQANLLRETGQNDKALKAYENLIAEAGESDESLLGYLTAKGQILSEIDRPKEALEAFSAALKKAEKGTSEWLAVQFNRGDLLKKDKKPSEAAKVFDEILTLDSLSPVQEVMILIYSAETHHEAKNQKETADRIARADKILAELKKAEEIPPQYLEQFEDRLNTVRTGKDGKKAEKSEQPKAEEKPEAEKPEAKTE